jgi:multiple sugar transport system permease protein
LTPRLLLGLRTIILLLFVPTKSGTDLLTRGAFSFGSLHNVWLAWRALDSFQDHMFLRWMKNSIVYTLGATALTMITAIPAGYGLAVGRFPGRKAILALTLIAMVMPPATLILPIFLELNAVHLIGSALSVILPLAFYPFAVYLAYLYFSTALPAGLLDAARIDGCTDWQTFRLIAVPLAKPLIAFVFFFAFVSDWNNFFLPYVVLVDSSQFPVEVGLSDILQGPPSEIALATSIAVAPVVLVFVLSQRALVRGLVTGSGVG